jgi:ubiquinone/menaquinone biosynthesis C-methylase UbiE
LEFRLKAILKEGILCSVPHDSWANSYDQLFEASFGSHLANLTDLTMEIVLELSEPSESILDIGAGTGRMSLPLIESNFYVSSLDPSAGMLSQLAKKLPNHPNLELIHCPVAELEMHERHHGALCIFTVSSYWLDESTLANSLRSIYNALLPNGWLIIDRTLKTSFSDTVFQNEKIQRQAMIEDLGGDLYRFTEQSTISSSKNIKQINDSFLIRYWEEDLFLDHVKATGFSVEQDLSQVFASSGASFYLLRKD